MIEVIPFDAALGAEVHCGRLQDVDEATASAIRAASLQYQVILIRGQRLLNPDLVAFGRVFGEFQYSNPLGSPLARERKAKQGGRFGDFPKITVVSNVVENGIAIGGLGDGEVVWHTDMSSFAEPPNQTILHAIELPSTGGRTGFANMYRAYDTLPPALKERTRALVLKHDATVDAAGYVRSAYKHLADADPEAAPGTEHPLVRTHPDTGRNCLYLGRRARAYICGLPRSDSEVLLDQLWQHATHRELTWFHEWRIGDVLIWDNRCVMHRREPFDSRERRTLHRVVISGTKPVGPAITATADQ
ncbi:MAG: TauD/TfdA family dioxygenase [Burkholderiales bacterium]|nr:TauD/TfdA family dioxygenase [Burkholderiales bacterium]